MTSLQINGSSAAATTLAAAGKLFSATGGTSGNVSTKVGTSTQFKQIFAKGTTTTQTGVASLPAPTDSNFAGWMWDVTTLEGQNILAGTWTPTVSLLASTSTTVTPTVQWYKRSSGGVYTQIGSVTGSSIALSTSAQALTFTPPSLSLMNFATGDRLCMWLWVNQTAGGATNSTISVVEDTGGTAGVASAAQTATPGYGPALSVTMTGVGTCSDTWMNVQAQDTFAGRTVSGSFGTASDGESYTVLNAFGQVVSVGSGKGTVYYDGVDAHGYSDYAVRLGSQTLSDAVLLCRVQTGTLTGVPSVFFYVRYNAGGTSGNDYNVELAFNGASSTLSLNYRLSFASTTITSATVTANASTFYWLRLQVSGTSIAAKMWADGTTEPSAWTLSSSDSHVSGAGGFVIETAATGTTAATGLTIDSYSVGLVGPFQLATALSATMSGVGTLSETLSLSTVLATTLVGVGTVPSTLSASLAFPSTALAGTSQLAMSAPSLSTALAETCAGTGTLIPALSASLVLPAATLAGVGTLSGTAQLTTALATTLVGVGTLTPTLSLATALAVTCAGTGTLSETLSAQAALSGTLTGSGTLSMGSPSLAAALADTMTGTGTLTPTLGAATALVGEADGSGTLAVLLSLATTLSGECDGVGTLTASLSTSSGGSAALSCECDGVGTLTSTLSATAPLAVTCASTGTLAGSSLTLATALSANVAGTGTLTPALSASLVLPSIQLPGSGQLTPSLTASATLAETCAGTSQLSISAPSLSTSLADTLTGTGTLVGMLMASLSMTATCTGDGTCTGTLAQSTALVTLCAGAGALAMGTPFLTTALAGKSRGQGMLIASVTLILYALERATTWTTRDLAGTWQARDLSASWRTRDTTDTWQTRDHRATWEARDLVTTWKE